MKRLCSILIIFAMLVCLASCKATEANGELKYIFMFIGDGMSFNTVQLTRNMLSDGDFVPKELSFTDFDTVGVFTNYDATSFIPDSASSGTAMATGEKVPSGNIAMTESGKELDSIATTLKDKYGMKIGIITTANLNHATPSVFYAHSNSRYSYREVGEYLAISDFDFFAGGRFLDETDSEISLVELAEKNGYTILDTAEEIKHIDKDTKNIIISPDCDRTGMIQFNIDRNENALSLSDYLETAIDTLDNENGFFIMCEAARIDSALHANDARTAIGEVEELSNAVQAALDFYKKHPNETLILVTGDHETGGLSLGYTPTDYSLYLKHLSKQKVSYLTYEDNYAQKYIAEKTPFDTVVSDLEALFGLSALDEHEYERLTRAYKKTLGGTASYTETDLFTYGSRTPLTLEATRLTANRAGVSFSSLVHTASTMCLWARGAGEEIFSGTYDNTDVYNKLYALLDK